VKISDWDHYLITIQNINQQQTDVLNALSFQADSLPIGGAGPLLHKLIRNYYTEIQEEGQDLSTIRKLPLSLGKMLQNQLEQSFKRKQFFIRNIPLWMEPLQKEQRITKEDTGQLLSAFPYLMRLKYSFQTEEGKERTENPEKTSISQTRGPLFFLNNITQLLFSKNKKGRKLLQAWNRNFHKDFFNTSPYGLQDKIQKREALFQEENGITNNPRRLKKPKSTCHRTLEGLGFWNMVENEPPLLSSDSKIAYWALINYCRLEQQDLSETRTRIMKSKGSQDPYVQEAILSVSDINCQMIQLQIRINELLRFPCIAPYLLLPLDQREESLIRNCIERQGSLYLLLDYEPTIEDIGYSCSYSDLTIPYIPDYLTHPGAEQLKSSPTCKQESFKLGANVEPLDSRSNQHPE